MSTDSTTASTLSTLYIDHYPSKFPSPTWSPTSANSTLPLQTNNMLALVAAAPFPIPTTLAQSMGLPTNTSSSLLARSLNQRNHYIERFFNVVVTEQGYHWEIAHTTFPDWKWWKQVTANHPAITHAQD